MHAQINGLLEDIVGSMVEDELDALVQEAEELLDECGLEVEAASYEEYAEVLESITLADLDDGLTESDQQELVEIFKSIASGIKKAAAWVGSKVGAYQAKQAQKAKAKRVKSRARNMAFIGFKKSVKDAFGSGKNAGKTGYDAASKAKKQGAAAQRRSAAKGGGTKLKPGEKMVFGRVVKVNDKPNMAAARA